MKFVEINLDSKQLSNNEAIRALLKKSNFTLWQLADALGVSEATITRMMRHEVSDEKYDEIVTLIRSMRNSIPEEKCND